MRRKTTAYYGHGCDCDDDDDDDLGDDCDDNDATTVPPLQCSMTDVPDTRLHRPLCRLIPKTVDNNNFYNCL